MEPWKKLGEPFGEPLGTLGNLEEFPENLGGTLGEHRWTLEEPSANPRVRSTLTNSYRTVRTPKARFLLGDTSLEPTLDILKNLWFLGRTVEKPWKTSNTSTFLGTPWNVCKILGAIGKHSDSFGQRATAWVLLDTHWKLTHINGILAHGTQTWKAMRHRQIFCILVVPWGTFWNILDVLGKQLKHIESLWMLDVLLENIMRQWITE
jgi:hypothetical protein